VVHTENNQVFSAQAYFTSETQAHQYMAAQVAQNPALYDSLQVVPQHEAA
jgi:hypothetical protein